MAIGSVMWGNEPDTWRYGKPKFFWPAPPMVIAFAVGLVLFVAGGWMMAQLSGAGQYDFGPAFHYTVEYSLFGALWLGAVWPTVLQVAINDGNYYEMINGGQNVVGGMPGWRRWYTCLLMAVDRRRVHLAVPERAGRLLHGGELVVDRAAQRHRGDVRGPVLCCPGSRACASAEKIPSWRAAGWATGRASSRSMVAVAVRRVGAGPVAGAGLRAECGAACGRNLAAGRTALRCTGPAVAGQPQAPRLLGFGRRPPIPRPTIPEEHQR